MFGKRRKTQAPAYDREEKRPVIRASICTGEQVAGFEDRKTGKFEELELIRTPDDLKQFCARYKVRPEEIQKRW